MTHNRRFDEGVRTNHDKVSILRFGISNLGLVAKKIECG